jgi:hypothetical protein
MLSKIRVHLQQFGIIHLSNSGLTYIRNPERNKIMFVPFHLLQIYIRNPSLFFISFVTLPPTEKRRWQPRYAHRYARGEVSFFKFLFLPSWFAKLLEANFSWHTGRWVLPSWFAKLFEVIVLPKLDFWCKLDLVLTSELCQIVGDELFFYLVYLFRSWFAKLLEVIFSCFAKIRWMTSWFVKLLELL